MGTGGAEWAASRTVGLCSELLHYQGLGGERLQLRVYWLQDLKRKKTRRDECLVGIGLEVFRRELQPWIDSLLWCGLQSPDRFGEAQLERP